MEQARKNGAAVALERYAMRDARRREARRREAMEEVADEIGRLEAENASLKQECEELRSRIAEREATADGTRAAPEKAGVKRKPSGRAAE